MMAFTILLFAVSSGLPSRLGLSRVRNAHPKNREHTQLTVYACSQVLHGGQREEEVYVAQELLQTMGILAFTPLVISCPGCGRTSSDFFQILAQEIQTFLRKEMSIWKKKFKGVEDMKVAVMGCVVNGPGESKNANIGISLPGSGENPVAPVYVDGVRVKTLKGDAIAQEFEDIVNEYVRETYGS